ncbi:MAG: hypothetical protein R2778_03665 [Saprospiraceae bacterium]
MKIVQEFNMKIADRKRSLQVSLDIFNFGNMINADWGRRYFITNDAYQLINYKGNDGNGDPTFTFKAPSSDVWNIDESGIISSVWQAQLGVRLNF